MTHAPVRRGHLPTPFTLPSREPALGPSHTTVTTAWPNSLPLSGRLGSLLLRIPPYLPPQSASASARWHGSDRPSSFRRRGVGIGTSLS